MTSKVLIKHMAQVIDAYDNDRTTGLGDDEHEAKVMLDLMEKHGVLGFLRGEAVKWVLERMQHQCPTCGKTLTMDDDAWRDHTELHVKLIEQDGSEIAQLKEAALEAVRKVSESETASSSTLPPGEKGIGGQMMTGWIRAEPFADLLEAAYVLRLEEQRASDRS